MPLLASDVINLTSTDERTVVDLAGRGMAPLMALGRYRYLQAHDRLPPQRHRTLTVLALPTRGAFTFAVDGKPHHLGPGQVLYLPPGSTYVTGATAEPRGELTWLIARSPDGAPLQSLDRAVALLAATPEPVIRIAPQDATADLKRAFQLAANPRNWISDAQLQHMLATVVFSLAQSLTGPPEPADPVHRDIARTLAWIDTHLTEPIDATDLAAVSGLSTSRFYQAFGTVTGTSPKDYLLRRKTDYARDWLERDPNVCVTEIAHTLGFSSSQYFSTVFRRYQHTTPSAYRLQART